MRGDIILFASVGKWTDRIIVWADKDHGKFVHVEIDLGDGKSIGEHTAGLLIHNTPTQPGVVFVSLKHIPPSEIERSEEHTSELQPLVVISYAVFCLKTTTDPIRQTALPP